MKDTTRATGIILLKSGKKIKVAYHLDYWDDICTELEKSKFVTFDNCMIMTSDISSITWRKIR